MVGVAVAGAETAGHGHDDRFNPLRLDVRDRAAVVGNDLAAEGEHEPRREAALDVLVERGQAGATPAL
jgi:hypothetical protein